MDISRVDDGPKLVAHLIHHRPESASAILHICLKYELGGDDQGILYNCPIKHYLADPAWREYVANEIIEHWGEYGAGVIYEYYVRYQDPDYPTVILSHLHAWRYIAALHPDWVPAWTSEYETYYTTLYQQEREAYATGGDPTETQVAATTR